MRAHGCNLPVVACLALALMTCGAQEDLLELVVPEHAEVQAESVLVQELLANNASDFDPIPVTPISDSQLKSDKQDEGEAVADSEHAVEADTAKTVADAKAAGEPDPRKEAEGADVVPEHTLMKKILPEHLHHRLVGSVDDWEDRSNKSLNEKNSHGLNKITGNGVMDKTLARQLGYDKHVHFHNLSHHYKKSGDGRVLPPGYVASDAHVGPHGHYYLGPSRRRIGAGFGRRRAEEKKKPKRGGRWQARQAACAKKAGGMEAKVQLDGFVQGERPHHEGVKGARIQFERLDGKGDPVVAHSDETGKYRVDLTRCTLYRDPEVFADGYVLNSGDGACSDPIMYWHEHEKMTHQLSKPTKDSEVKVVMTWSRNDADKYLKDLDLHMLIPGVTHTVLPHYANVTDKVAEAQSQEILDGKLDETKIMATFESTEIGQHMDDLDPHFDIHWGKTGSQDSFPYATYHTDQGSWGGPKHGFGGPENILVHQRLDKQYLVWVDQWSAENYENMGWDEKHKEGLTTEALEQFMNSNVFVRVVQGNKQTYCRSNADAISPLSTMPHTRWDAFILRCRQGNTANPSKCVVVDINAYNQNLCLHVDKEDMCDFYHKTNGKELFSEKDFYHKAGGWHVHAYDEK